MFQIKMVLEWNIVWKTTILIEDYRCIPQSFSDNFFRNVLENIRLRSYFSQSITVTFTAM
jgi:hypothetical protein